MSVTINPGQFNLQRDTKTSVKIPNFYIRNSNLSPLLEMKENEIKRLLNDYKNKSIQHTTPNSR